MSELIYSIRDIFGSDGSTACLPQSNCRAFWIPAYQRGYKWGADGEAESAQPVDQLLSDLKRAWQNGAREYLLQAITVKQVNDDGQDWVLEVIDGQQRLTTLFILLHALERRLGNQATPCIAASKLLYSIRHEGSGLDGLVAGWLNVSTTSVPKPFSAWGEFQNAGQEEHQDNAYLRRAALRCLYEFRAGTDVEALKDDDAVRRFQTYLLNHVKLLVNRVEPHVEGEAIFAALNSNRVALTECELIKGVLLTRVARRPSNGRDRRYREILELRIQLGRKWDEIQHWASRKDIGSFYFGSAPQEASSPGMMRMLELAVRLSQKGHKPSRPGKAPLRHPLFSHIFELGDQSSIFDRLISTYARLRDWYEADATYHLLGYCLTDKTQDRISLLITLLSYDTKTQVREELLRRRRQMLSPKVEGDTKRAISELSYPEDSGHLQHIFLALSVFSDDQHGRFNFHAYAGEDWSLEHIFPQTPFGKGAALTEEQKTAALDFLQQAEDLSWVESPEDIAKLRNEIGQADLKDSIEEVLHKVSILHQAGNLCLLSSQDNASIGCGMFDEKRTAIQQRIAKGSFVPRHTYKVFSKMIGKGGEKLTVWSKADADCHSKVIEAEVTKLINETE